MLVQTAEIGTRFSPERSERRLTPFLDLRVGYVSAYDANLGAFADQPYNVSSAAGTYGSRYSRGFGGVAGVGAEYTLTRTISLTSGVSLMQSRLSTRDFQMPGAQAFDPNFGMTAFRYTIGFRYNPIRMILPQGTDRP
jgi:hypothetical protein